MNLSGSVNVIVKANSSKNKIVGYDDDKKAYKIKIRARAESGKANLELLKFLSKVSGKKVEILKGKTSKNKVLRFY